ncbi:MAG: class III extradiol ring-cleavage dioxygenase, partial [Myxococcota bacterium]
DYGGFPQEAYELQWPAPGHPAVATEVRQRLERAGFATDEDAERGFDHGVFIPLLAAFPAPAVPVVQLSLKRGLDPAEHLSIGRALAPLRDDGVFIVGSGNSFHNLRAFFRERTSAMKAHSEAFDAWLASAIAAPADQRAERLTGWAQAPSARASHPREEHLLPLMVVAGAAEADLGTVAWSGTQAGFRISAHHFG